MKRNSIPLLGAAAAGRDGATPLNPVEIEAMHLFVQLSRALGQPPSVAEIYGLLFVSPKPLNQDDLINRINLSKGSASQGLRYLLDMGAVRTAYVPGDRRAHYEAVAELRNLVSRFLRQQVFTYFEDSGDRLDRLNDEAKKLTGEQREFALNRVKMLRSWRRNAKFLLPVLMKVLGGGNGEKKS
jgi:HTH-type transcriptional regulator, glycine betaine synthesis regulator